LSTNRSIVIIYILSSTALKYHPDQAGSAPATLEAFRRVQDAYGVLSRAAVKRSYDATLQIATNQAKAASVASAAKHANPMRGENVLKNVAFSRPASDWTGTREKYRHETWQGLSLNVKKVKLIMFVYFLTYFVLLIFYIALEIVLSHRHNEQLRCTAFLVFRSLRSESACQSLSLSELLAQEYTILLGGEEWREWKNRPGNGDLSLLARQVLINCRTNIFFLLSNNASSTLNSISFSCR
jgi:curved DNA-binding protein CbpA